jgi:hypothetical protein
MQLELKGNKGREDERKLIVCANEDLNHAMPMYVANSLSHFAA